MGLSGDFGKRLDALVVVKALEWSIAGTNHGPRRHACRPRGIKFRADVAQKENLSRWQAHVRSDRRVAGLLAFRPCGGVIVSPQETGEITRGGMAEEQFWASIEPDE